MIATFGNIVCDSGNDKKLTELKDGALFKTRDDEYFIYNMGKFVDYGFATVIKTVGPRITGYDEKKYLREWITLLPTLDDVIEILNKELNCKADSGTAKGIDAYINSYYGRPSSFWS